MRIKFVEIRNFRRLRSVRIDFADETTVFVGANNSGKTSAMTALRCFLVSKTFTTNDFTLSNWALINDIGKEWESLAPPIDPKVFSLADWEAVLPSLDLWLQVENDEIHNVIGLLPRLDWEGGLLGARLRLEPKDVEDLYKEYRSARAKAVKTI
jgi:predicted ATP-dependent endonuclease of OLD family